MIFAAPVSNAVNYNFSCITDNDVTGVSCADAEAYLSVDVIDAGSNQVEFLFNNTAVGAGGFIADVYFYGVPFFSDYVMTASEGVAFTEAATPAALPAYGEEANVIFSADSDSPVAANGIQGGEWLSVLFDLKTDLVFSDIINLMGSTDAENLLVGIHAQGLGDDDYSESLVTAVPVPAALILFASGLIGLLGVAARRRN